MKCDKCANYLSGLDRCKFCSFEEDKSADHRLDAIRYWAESVLHDKLFENGFKPYVTLATNPLRLYEYKNGDNMIEDITINYNDVTENGVKAKSFKMSVKNHNVTVNGVKAKSFSLNAKDNEVVVEWEEKDFNLKEAIENKGINDGVNERLDRFDVDYVDCFYDRFISMLYIRTDDISLKNKSKIIDCLNIDAMNVSTLSDEKCGAFSCGVGKGWFAIRVE